MGKNAKIFQNWTIFWMLPWNKHFCTISWFLISYLVNFLVNKIHKNLAFLKNIIEIYPKKWILNWFFYMKFAKNGVSGARGSELRFRFWTILHNLRKFGSGSTSVPKNGVRTVGSSVSVRTDQALLNSLPFVAYIFIPIRFS